MDIKDLDKKLSLWAEKLAKGDRRALLARLAGLKSVFPFNEYEYRLMFLLNKEVINFKEYENLRNNYVKQNPYLDLYGLAPRIFGEVWVQQHLMDIDERFEKPSIDVFSNYQGEYDLYIPQDKKITKIEVKASRAINTKVRGHLQEKALNFQSIAPFWMNFQQIKLDIADAFIFVGVWTDKILYWVFTNDEVKTHPIISHQHRGGIEYQIGIKDNNINEFKKYSVNPTEIVDTILNKTLKKVK